jgi:hypothetical protein
MRFQVKNPEGGCRIVQVTRDFEVVPAHEGESLEGYNLDLLFCLGCSWKGSLKNLKRFLTVG